jgi:hypothetical protein
MNGRDRWLSSVGFQVIAALAACGVAEAQTAPNGLTAAGTGGRVDPYAFGAAPAAPGAYGAAQAAAAANAATAASTAATAALNRSMVTPNPALDPLGLNYVYGPAYGSALPMTGTQAGLSILMMQQRISGIGNGQLSGVRGGALSGTGARTDGLAPRDGGGAATSRAIAAHTRNMNIPGGQAARYFNRGRSPAIRNQPSYQRTTRYFPQTGQ